MTDPKPVKKPAAKKRVPKATGTKTIRTTVRKPVAKKTSEVVSAVPVTAVVKEKKIHHNYTFAVGRRKSAIARVRLVPKGTSQFVVNGREVDHYFPTFELRKIVRDAIELTKFGEAADISVKVQGGGVRGQAEAVRLGVSRVIVKLDPELRTTLKKAGFLTRDPRVKERKKYGLKRARRAPQWQKR